MEDMELKKFIERLQVLASDYNSGNYSDIGMLNLVAVAGEHAISKAQEFQMEYDSLVERNGILERSVGDLEGFNNYLKKRIEKLESGIDSVRRYNNLFPDVLTGDVPDRLSNLISKLIALLPNPLTGDR